ncbi:hypothetical protein, partial [Salmonella enterica]|uniref:hypothetical protein n=1 Tax=Salmonella enterica TaxID=28901 RepID=UPI0039ED0138
FSLQEIWMTSEFLIQIGISLISALAMGAGVYVGMVRALATHEERLDNHRHEIDALKARVDRLEAPFFTHK